MPLYAVKKQYPFVYMRKKGRERFVVALNPTKNTVKAGFEIAGGPQLESVSGGGSQLKYSGKKLNIEMQPFSYEIFKA
jgi:hypothetical protein